MSKHVFGDYNLYWKIVLVKKSRGIQKKERRPLSFNSWERLYGLCLKIHTVGRDRLVTVVCSTVLPMTRK